MDRSNPHLIRFSQALAGMDDDALAALANKGLVRRARKDMEKGAPSPVGADAESVSLQMEGQTVRLVQPAGKSTCSCASGICRHILASLIHLRESAAAATAQEPSPAASAASPADEIAAIDEASLVKWAGRPLMKRAAVALSRGYEVENTPASALVRLPAQNIIVRCLPGGLDAMLCSCHAAGACEHKVAAVLALAAHKSGRPVEVPQAMLEASSGAPRSRDEVRASVAELLGEMVAMGLSRLSTAAEQRLRTLATSAQGVDLPRLQRMLKALADEVSMTLKRDASASSGPLLISCARLAALCEALERPTPALVGEHRSVYMPVAGSIDLMGLGARRWRTRSGYHGLTVLLWEPASKRWTGWNDARPIGTPGFDPAARFDEGGPWAGCPSPRHAAATVWRLTGVHRNGAGRITARESTRGIASRASRPGDGPLVSDYRQLGTMAADAFAPSLAERRDHADLVLLAPAQWGEAEYDKVHQEVSRPIFDAAGRCIPLILRHSPETDHALTTLERIDGAMVMAVLGSMRIGPSGLFVEPTTLWTPAKPIHLTLDGAVKTAAPPAAPAEPGEEEAADDADDEKTPVIEASAVGHVLLRVENDLLAIAESGVGVIRDLSGLWAAARELSAVGMASSARAITLLCDELESHRKRLDRDPMSPARRLLQAVYVTHVAAACQTVALVARSM